MRAACRGERDHAKPEGREGIQAGGRKGDAAQGDCAEKSTAQPDRGADPQLVDQLGERVHRGQLQRHHAEHQDEDDGRGVVESGLGLEQAGDAARQGHDAQHREHRGGVGDGHDGAEQQRQLPVDPEQQVRTRGGDHHADRDAHGGQRRCGRQHLSHVAEPRREAAFDEDDRQRHRAEVLGEQVVVELQSQPVFADDDADAEEQQQARQPDPARRPGGDDAGQQHEPSGQQHQIQLLQAHFIPVRDSVGGVTCSNTYHGGRVGGPAW